MIRKLLVEVCALSLFVCATVSASEQVQLKTAKVNGYLASQQTPDAIALLPKPPVPGSAGQTLDEAVSRSGLALRDTPRWKLAIQDADTSFDGMASSFSCALGCRISRGETPVLFRLLRRAQSDAGVSVSRAKNAYGRPRPFMVNGHAFCTPAYERELRRSGSYPSGHTAAGWTWALILGELAPDRFDALLQRARAYGDSRIVCNVHWNSDVSEGRIVAAALVARLHGDAAFRADLELARAELNALRGRVNPEGAACRDEANALALFPH